MKVLVRFFFVLFTFSAMSLCLMLIESRTMAQLFLKLISERALKQTTVLFSNTKKSSEVVKKTSDAKTIELNKLHEKDVQISKEKTALISNKKVVARKSKSISNGTLIYKYKDNNGNIIISDIPPVIRSYKVQLLGDDRLNVVNMKPANPTNYHQRKNYKRRRDKIKRRTISAKNSKQLLVAENNVHCRWLVGRSYDLYQRIKRHKEKRTSIACAEYAQNLTQMAKLGREGYGCNFPYRYPRACK